MREYNLAVDNLLEKIKGEATEDDFGKLVLAHNVLKGILGPVTDSDYAKKIMVGLDESMVGSPFFDSEKVSPFRNLLGMYYDAKLKETKSLPENSTLEDELNNGEVQTKKVNLDYVFVHHIKPYVSATEPIVYAVIPDRFLDRVSRRLRSES